MDGTLHALNAAIVGKMVRCANDHLCEDGASRLLQVQSIPGANIYLASIAMTKIRLDIAFYCAMIVVMANKVKHLQIYKPGPFGGTINTTICGRVQNEQDYNVADGREDVTCSYCKRLIEENFPVLKWEGYAA